jgi:hypothetical protein
MKRKKQFNLLLSNEIDAIGEQSLKNTYAQMIANIKRDSVKIIKRDGIITATAMKKIVVKYNITKIHYLKIVKLGYASAGVQIALHSRKATSDLKVYRQVLKFSPKVIASSLNKVIEGKGRVAPIFKQIGNMITRDDKIMQRLGNKYARDMEKLNLKIKTNLSRDIVDRWKKASRSTLFKTKNEVANAVRKDFGDNFRVERIIRTEVHSRNEAVKEIQAINQGFTTKQWFTQPGASKSGIPRATHARLNNQKKPIQSLFNVGSSKGEYPGDNRLSVKERVNCVCILIYS